LKGDFREEVLFLCDETLFQESVRQNLYVGLLEVLQTVSQARPDYGILEVFRRLFQGNNLTIGKEML
jgi:hypothetical protein